MEIDYMEKFNGRHFSYGCSLGAIVIFQSSFSQEPPVCKTDSLVA